MGENWLNLSHCSDLYCRTAKTLATRSRRFLHAVNALALGLGFPEMIRVNKKKTVI